MNVRIILPILIISALLILLAGCVTTPSDESPGVTGTGTIIGTIASPCCSLSDEMVTETPCVPSEYWCCYCEAKWFEQDGIEVVLTYGENEVATTTTNADGEYTFTDVPPGSNYVVTAYCPDYKDNRPLVKDVALEVESTFDTKITDLASTSLGLVVDFLVYYTEWGPEDISLDAVIADQPTYPNFSKFRTLIYEVRRVLENCELNLLTDDDVQYATCRAAEEISGLDIGCGAGFTETGGGDTYYKLNLLSDPIGGAATLEGAGTYLAGTTHAVSTTPNPCYKFINWTGDAGEVDTTSFSVTMSSNMTLTAHFKCPVVSPDLVIDITGPIAGDVIDSSKGRSDSDLSICSGDCARINSVTVNSECQDAFPKVFTPPYNPKVLDFDFDKDNISFSYSNGDGEVCYIGTGNLPYLATIVVTYTDPCGYKVATGTVTVEFKDCSCVAPTADAGSDQSEEVCPGKKASIDFVGNGTGTGISYAWDFDVSDGITEDSTEQNPENVAFGVGTYTVTLTVTGDCGSDTDEMIVTITESAVVTADAGSDQSEEVCPGKKASIDFVGNGTGTGISYSWDFDNGGTTEDSTDQDPQNVDFGEGTYTVTLTVTGDCGRDTDEMIVTITESPLPTADAGPDQCIQLGCESEVLVSFVGSGSSGECLVYDWNFDDGTTHGTGETPSHTYPAGTYNVSLTITDSCNRSDTDSMVLTIHGPCGNLPDKLTISYSSMTVSDYYLKVKFSDGSGDIQSDTLYYGWCAHSGLNGIPRPLDEMFAYCTLELDTYWNKINWIVNNRSTYTKMEVQNAIWHYIHGMSVSGDAQTLVGAADLHSDFCPGIGDKYIVLLTHDEIDTYGIYKCDHYQNILIEVIRINHCPE